MSQSEPVRYEQEGGAQYNMIAEIRRAAGIRPSDLREDDLSVAPSTHLIGMRLDPDIEALIPEGRLAEIVETAASRILHENFAIRELDHFEIDYRHVSIEDIAEMNPDFCHEDAIGMQEFEDAGITPLGGDEPASP